LFNELGLDGTVLPAGNSGKIPFGQIKKYLNNNGNNNVHDTTTGKYERNQYYFHPDHLGSTSYLSDASGEVYQHVEYLPFGETMVEEHNNSNVNPYLYNGKELDMETGLYYYGKRYYDAQLGRFYTQDRFAEKYYSMTPYQYGGNNPIVTIDVNGDSLTANAWEWANQITKYAKNKTTSNNKKLFNLKTKLNNGDIKQKDYDRKTKRLNESNTEFTAAINEIGDLVRSNQWYDVKISDDLGKSGDLSVLGKLTYDTKTGVAIINLLKSDANVGNAAHEFKHAYEFDIGGYALMPDGSGAANTEAWDIYEERDANKRGAAFGSSTMSEESGNTKKTYIDENHIKKYINNHLIYRYNGKTYK